MEEVKSDPQSLTTTNAAAATNGGVFCGFFQVGRPKLRLTSEYDSETSVFFPKVSCKLLDNLAKLKLSFQNNSKGEVSDPQISFTSKFFSLHYDVEENDALLKTSFEMAPGLQFRATHSVKCEIRMSSASRWVFMEALRWSIDLEVMFIDIMYEEVLRGNILGSSFSKTVWINIQQSLQAQCAHHVSIKQLREKLSRIKTNWRRYKDLMLTDPGLGWDCEMDVPLVDDNWWNLYLERRPKDSGLRNRPCRRYLKLCVLFERNTVTGSKARSSTQRPPDIVLDDQEVYDIPFDVEDDYSLGDDTNLHTHCTPTASGVSKRRRRKCYGLERLIQSFENTNQTILSRLSETSKKECEDVMVALRQLLELDLEKRVKVADYYAKNKMSRLMFLACTPDERHEYVKFVP